MPSSPKSQDAVQNRLLAALPRNDYLRLAPRLEVIPLVLGEVLYEPGQPIPYVHFPTRGVIATMVRMKDGATAEAGMVGREGMVCVCTFLEVDITPFQATVENPGEALRMKALDFRAEVARSVSLHRLMQRYVDAFLVLVSQSAACNGLHSLEQRCARWLLMTQDRVEQDFFLTQEFLAKKLGVLRTSVSEVAHKLQKAGLIRYSRGRVTVLNRKGLEALSCECYWSIKAKFDTLPGGPSPGR